MLIPTRDRFGVIHVISSERRRLPQFPESRHSLALQYLSQRATSGSCTAIKRLLITLVVAPIKAERREAQQARMFVIGSRLKRLGRTTEHNNMHCI